MSFCSHPPRRAVFGAIKLKRRTQCLLFNLVRCLHAKVPLKSHFGIAVMHEGNMKMEMFEFELKSRRAASVCFSIARQKMKIHEILIFIFFICMATVAGWSKLFKFSLFSPTSHKCIFLYLQQPKASFLFRAFLVLFPFFSSLAEFLKLNRPSIFAELQMNVAHQKKNSSKPIFSATSAEIKRKTENMMERRGKSKIYIETNGTNVNWIIKLNLMQASSSHICRTQHTKERTIWQRNKCYLRKWNI